MNCVSNADRDPATPSISVGKVTQKTNLCGGILGFGFWILLTVLLIRKSIVVLGKTQVKVQSFIQNDQSTLRINTTDSLISLYICQIVAEKCVPVGPNYRKEYGFEVIMVQYFIWYNPFDQRVHNDVKLKPMVACPDDQDIYCAPEQFQVLKIQCEMQKVGPLSQCNQSMYYDILIRKCLDPDCAEQVSQNLVSSLFFYNNDFNVFNPKTSEVMKQQAQGINNFHSVFNQQNQYVYCQFFSKLSIETDQSILPSLVTSQKAEKIQTWFYPNKQELYIDYYPYSKHRYTTYQFRRSYNTQRYRRSYVKIDTMLAQILGFMGLISWLVTILCASYNSYLLEEHIGSIKDEQVRTKGKSKYKSRQQEHLGYQFQRKPNLKSYMKFLWLKFKSFFTCKQQQQSNFIDIYQIYKKVNKLQSQLIELRSEKSLPSSSNYYPKQYMANNRQDQIKQSLLSQNR